MIVGVPKETKPSEYRVSMLPVGVEELVQTGHTVLVEVDAGVGSGIPNEDYTAAGATLLETAPEIFAAADLIVKVKEPMPEEYDYLREGQVVFTYFHFAANEDLIHAMIERRIVCVAYETIQTADGELPLLTPMSEVAGKMAIQEGAKYLEKPMMGRGILLGGVPGVAPAKVLIIGGGIVGTNAAKVAAGLGAEVTIMDVNLRRLRYLDDIMPPNVVTLMSDPHTVREKVKSADLLIGAVLIPGGRTPHLVTEEMVSTMTPGAVIVDVSVDQGGCIETTRPTTHQNPTFIKHGVVHYCVTNMPGAVGRTSTYALANVTRPYIVALANKGWKRAMREDVALAKGLNIADGKICFRAVAKAFGMAYFPTEELIVEESP
ncbi:alanine dehydrogenase [Candidatus Poribacteria bacterium]|nr:alanine dehydrogenase [Candidatus Poribacteria bacterium]